MQLEIITPEKKIYTGEIKLVQVPGSKGSFEILNNHAPIISTLENGEIKIIDLQDRIVYFDISGGVIEVNQNKIIILAEIVLF
jgi:F-type H+-transporting ATPase subunit epsilon